MAKGKKGKPARSSRQQKSRDIARQKGKQIRHAKLRRRVVFGSVFVLVGCVSVGGWLGWRNGDIQRIVENTHKGFWQMTANAGFKVEKVYLSGRETTDVKAINEVLDVQRGSPILAVSVTDVKARLEALPEVRSATVERELPNTLHIKITERTPVAVWQHEGKEVPVDMDGKLLANRKLETGGHYLVVAGEDAPAHVGALMETLTKDKELYGKVIAAVRVGDRRWNLKLAGDITLMLPEEGMEKAWLRLAKVEREQKILSKAIETIDMRIENRIFMKTNANDQKEMIVATDAKST